MTILLLFIYDSNTTRYKYKKTSANKLLTFHFAFLDSLFKMRLFLLRFFKTLFVPRVKEGPLSVLGFYFIHILYDINSVSILPHPILMFFYCIMYIPVFFTSKLNEKQLSKTLYMYCTKLKIRLKHKTMYEKVQRNL